MKNFVIKGVYAVGMHHWGQRSLQIDDVLYVKNEPDNRFDKNAVAIFKDREMTNRCAYLQNKYAKVLVRLFEENLPRGLVYLKAKDEPTKFSPYSGPKQRCNLGFKTDNEHIPKIKELLEGHAIDLKIF